MYFTWSVRIRAIFWFGVRIVNTAPKKHEFDLSEITANYSVIFEDNSMIFISLDSADFPLFKNIKISLCLCKDDLKKKKCEGV